MKKTINHIAKSQFIKATCFLLILLTVAGIASHAQPPDIGGDVDAPIDGGLSLLVAAGMGYGAKKLRENRKAKP